MFADLTLNIERPRNPRNSTVTTGISNAKESEMNVYAITHGSSMYM